MLLKFIRVWFDADGYENQPMVEVSLSRDPSVNILNFREF